MAEQQVIRIRMRDRPGALSQICTALAAHGVDIVHLDVVSSDDGVVVDDLALEGKEPGDIARAVRGFLPDVVVSPLPGRTTEPVIEFGTALFRIARASNDDSALSCFAEGAGQFVRANQAVFLRLKASTSRIQPSLAGLPDIDGSDPCAARAVFAPATVATFAGSSEWAPATFRETLGAEYVALAPVGSIGALALARQGNIPFTIGELQRLALYTKTSVALMPFATSGEPVAPSEDVLPADAVTVPL